MGKWTALRTGVAGYRGKGVAKYLPLSLYPLPLYPSIPLPLPFHRLVYSSSSAELNPPMRPFWKVS